MVGRSLGVVLALLVGSCGSTGLDEGFGVATTVLFDSSVTDEALGEVTSLLVTVTGDETYSATETITKPARVQRFVYRPLAASHLILMNVTALDANGGIVAAGQSDPIPLSPGATSQTDLVLRAVPPGSTIDGSVLVGDHGLVEDQGIGPFDAGGVDGSGGVSRCDALVGTPGYLNCVGFETAEDIQNPVTTSGTLTLDTSRFFRGASSMHAHTSTAPPSDAAYHGAQARAEATLGKGNEIHVRAFVYLSGTLPAATPLLNVATYYGASVASPNVLLGIAPDHTLFTQIWSIADMATVGDHQLASATKLPMDTWACLEVAYVPTAGSNGLMQVFLDDVHVSDLDYSGPTLIDNVPPSGVELGLQFTTSGPFDEWIDELMVSTLPIGCEK